MDNKLDSILQAHVAQGDDTTDKILGAAFAVVNKDGILYSGSAGRSGMDPASRPFDKNTFSWMASMTKLITSTCIMHLVEQGKANLDDDLRPLVPELAAMQILRGFDGDKPILEDNNKPITFRILLTHTLGLAYDLADPDLMKWSQVTGRTVNCMSWSRDGFATPIKFAPGDAWLYGTALDWAAIALQAITGDTIGTYMQRHIFDPVGMEDTGFWPEKLNTHVQERSVEPVERKAEAGGKLEIIPPWQPKEHEIESGGAGLYGTAGDYTKFLQAFIRGELLSEDSMQLMFTPQLNDAQREALKTLAYEAGEEVRLGFVPEFPRGAPISQGLAGLINLEDVDGKRRKGSMMWSGMANSRWWVDRETGIAAVLFANLLPFGDKVIASLYDQLERGVYEAFGRKAT